MQNHAIVIGIDKYQNPNWNLGAAVADANRFAQWALTRGGVRKENLHLLLSPLTPFHVDLPYQEATARAMRKTIQEYQIGSATADADRLYFYYAGHGLSAGAAPAGSRQEPVLIPCDVESVAVDWNLLVGFSEIITVLNSVPPAEQLFFIDACRDFQLDKFQPAVGSGVGPWVPGRAAGENSAQLVIYATSPGQRAYEASARSRGVFADALLDALGGRAPAATVWDAQSETYQVRFTALSEQIRRVVKERVSGPANGQRYIQIPETLSFRSNDAVIAEFTEDEVAKIKIKVRVGPSAARLLCRISLSYPVPGHPEGLIVGEVGPPTKQNTDFEVSPGIYSLRAVADGYDERRELFEANQMRTFDLRLPRSGTVNQDPIVNQPQSLSLGQATLEVLNSDPLALVIIRDAQRRILFSGNGSLKKSLDIGYYYLQLVAPEGATVEKIVELSGSDTTRIVFEAPGPRLGAEQLAMLEKRGIQPTNGYLHPSELLDGFANASMATLLAFAAFASLWPRHDELRRLREFGVEPPTDREPGQSAIMFLLGVSGEKPAANVGRADFLDGAEFVLRDLEGRGVGVNRLSVLSGFPAAAQACVKLIPGCVIAEVRLPGLAPTRFALTALPNRLTLIVAGAEDSGVVDVHQFLLPLDASEGEYLTSDPKNLRRLELAQRAHDRDSEPLSQRDLIDLLYGKLLDPLLGAIAGYHLVAAGAIEQYRGTALTNMLAHFGRLPDSHVLAGLCEPERRDEHFAEADRLGIPVFADGFRALHRWRANNDGAGRSLWAHPGLLIAGSPWTSWVASRPALRVIAGVMEPAPVAWAMLETHRAHIETVVRSVGRLVERHTSWPYRATAFVVAPDVVMTMRPALPADANPDNFYVDFSDGNGEPAGRFDVAEILAAGAQNAGGTHVVLLRLKPASIDTAVGGSWKLPEPLRLASWVRRPAYGLPVFVCGYPSADSRVPERVVQNTFGGVFGVKRIQPGQILSMGNDDFGHDCLTLSGNGGSPVVDLASGLVIGFHHSGRWFEEKVGWAKGLWGNDCEPLLTSMGAHYEDPT